MPFGHRDPQQLKSHLSQNDTYCRKEVGYGEGDIFAGTLTSFRFIWASRSRKSVGWLWRTVNSGLEVFDGGTRND
jgi:hypothetical protein